MWDALRTCGYPHNICREGTHSKRLRLDEILKVQYPTIDETAAGNLSLSSSPRGRDVEQAVAIRLVKDHGPYAHRIKSPVVVAHAFVRLQ